MIRANDAAVAAFYKAKLHKQITALKEKRNTASPIDKKRLDAMIEFRKSGDAVRAFQELARYQSLEFIERACAFDKRTILQYEDVDFKKLAGNFFEKAAARFRPLTQLYRFFSFAARQPKKTRKGNQNGVLGGYVTDEYYQSPMLFPEFPSSQNHLPFLEKLRRTSAVTMEMRNRYRRVLSLSLCDDRLEYFKNLRKHGVGTPQKPMLIVSIGGGTGSVEMDIQEVLRDRYSIYTRIVILDVVDQNRINGSFFARMRGADIHWVIQKAGRDDLLTQQRTGTLDDFLSQPLCAVNAYGKPGPVNWGSYRSAQHIIMSGLWVNFSDEDVLVFLDICRRIMHPVAEIVVTLSRNTYVTKKNREKIIPSMRIINALGYGKEGVWYRSIGSLKSSGVLRKSGFKIKGECDGPIFPVIAMAAGDIKNN